MAVTPLLAGVRVLDLSSVGPASRASRILADYGAGVVKVGPVSRHGAVQIRPPYHSYGAGRGFKRLQVDLKADRGREAFLRLAAGAEVVIESFRPGVATRMGIGYDDVRRVREDIVYCSISGYGQSGPAAQWAGHDLNYLGVAGFLACSGRSAEGGPVIPGATLADSAGGGMQAAIAVLAALLQRSRNGQGAYLDVSVAEGVLSLMALSIDQYLATGEEAGPGQVLLTGRYACYDLYPARDGRWLSVAAIEPRFFTHLCEALGHPELAEHQLDDAHQDEIREAFRSAFARRDRDEWIKELAGRNACVAPVYTIPELLDDAQFAGRRVFVDVRHVEHGTFRQVGPVLAGGIRPDTVHVLPDPKATDTDELLAAAGLSGTEIASLRGAGVVE